MPTLLTAVKGIGPAAASNLTNHGITSAEELASVSVARLCQVPGYSTVLSQRIIADARALLAKGDQAGAEGSDDAEHGQTAGPAAAPASGVTPGKGKKEKKSSKKKRKTKKQETKMSKKSARKAKTLKKEIKSRKSKISRQDKKIKRLKKALKKVS